MPCVFLFGVRFSVCCVIVVDIGPSGPFLACLNTAQACRQETLYAATQSGFP